MRAHLDRIAAAVGAFALSLALIAGTTSVPTDYTNDSAALAATQEMI